MTGKSAPRGINCFRLVLIAAVACRGSDGTRQAHAGPPTAIDTMVTLIDSQVVAPDPWPYEQAIMCELRRATNEVGIQAANAAQEAAYRRHSLRENARVGKATGGRMISIDDKFCEPYLAARWRN